MGKGRATRAAILQRIMHVARRFLSGSDVGYFHNSVRPGAPLSSPKRMYACIERGNFLIGMTKTQNYRHFGNVEEFNVF